MTRAAVRRYVLAEHADVVEAVIDCADAVAADWSDDTTTDRDAVVPPLAEVLRTTGVLGRLPLVLAGAVEATGNTLSAPPVAAPPYVAVTSRGPVLRATLPDDRLVVTLAVFAVERGETVRYRRGGTTARESVEVALRR